MLTNNNGNIDLENDFLLDDISYVQRHQKSTRNRQKDQEKRKKCKRLRRKNNNQGSKYICSKCKRAYLSYPALYTHKRNKHNVIPITNKKTFKYNAVEQSVKDSISTIHKLLTIHTDSLFRKEDSVLYNENYNEKKYFPFKIIENFQKYAKVINPPPADLQPCIDDLLMRYIILFNQVSSDEELTSKNVKLLLIMREYLNYIGWDFEIEYAQFFNKDDFKQPDLPFTTCNNASNVPYLIQNFFPSFLELDSNKFGLDDNEVLDFLMNFCNWLFINNYTSFKLVKSV